MTPHHRFLLFVAAAALVAACVPTQRAVRGTRGKASEAWSWRMSATEGRWSSDRSQAAARTELEDRRAPAREAAEPEPAAAAEDEAEMTLEPDPVGPAKKPKAVAATVKAPRAERRAPARSAAVRASDSDEEFLDKILDDNADAEDGVITMAAMELPKSKKERAAAKKKLAAPVIDTDADLAASDLAPVKPAKKKRMTRAEKKKARLLARAEKKKAKEIAAREARLRGKRARIDEEERTRASHARKARRNKRKGQFFENGEGFIDEDEDRSAAEDDDEAVAASDDDDDEDEADDEDDDDEDEGDDEDEDARPARKKAKKQVVATSRTPSKPAARGKAVKVKTDWSGQAIDDEDPLKGKKK